MPCRERCLGYGEILRPRLLQKVCQLSSVAYSASLARPVNPIATEWPPSSQMKNGVEKLPVPPLRLGIGEMSKDHLSPERRV